VGDRGTILVVDDDAETRAAATQVAQRLGCDVREAENAELVLDELGAHCPTLAVIAVELPGPTNGLELLRELHERFGEELPVILVSGARTTSLDRVAGLMLGADDYIVKPLDTGELLARARRSLRRVNPTFGNGNGSANGSSRPREDVNLSPREQQILTLLAEGRSQAQIASTLVISPKTVATHIQHVLGKLGAHSRAQAVALAFQLGLVEPDVRAHGLIEALVPLD
jgi:two-component system nitrate/nitrite response regulator NarL